jgi:hypothetical protein
MDVGKGGGGFLLHRVDCQAEGVNAARCCLLNVGRLRAGMEGIHKSLGG